MRSEKEGENLSQENYNIPTNSRVMKDVPFNQILDVVTVSSSSKKSSSERSEATRTLSW